ncbi:SDR family oxidoreductase [Bartonella sp. HY761]|uniref:SDR family oxidoreductase n=1 Tax=Bartonella sp. HY761 TaxID=2979330 RepID=UPI002200E2AC|nr:SDR family oxidoreductase [Bartonella sp. HY761]UXN07639.1 SDR family oxidoreductase [Bartonella sp. HY761]
MDLGLKNKKAIICASSKGLGKACAFSLARAGCEITINGRDKEILQKAADEIQMATGVKVSIVNADVSTKEGQKALLSTCPDPDILVNNNGGPAFKNFRQLDKQTILAGLEQNMITPIELIQAVIDGMVSRKFGRIVNITSTSVYRPIPGLDLSSGARAGLTAFLAGVVQVVVSSNVTINNLLPGAFATDRLKGSLENEQRTSGLPLDDIYKHRMAHIPAKRFGNPEEFGDACAFLCSSKSGYITGQNLVIDGGSYASAF